MRLLPALLFLALFSQFSSAHLGGGEDRFVGDYIIEFSYAPAVPKQGEAVTIVLSLANNTTVQPIETEKILVRISDSDKLIFAGSFLPENSNVAVAYVFQRGGEYEIEPVFYKNGSILVSTKFKLAVEETAPIYLVLIPLVLIVLLSRAGGFISRHKLINQ